MAMLTAVLDVFSAIGTWITEAITELVPMFYDTNGLTFMGILAVAGLGVSIVLLLLNIIQNFLHFRG